MENINLIQKTIIIRQFTDNDIDYVILRQIDLYKTEYGFTSEAWVKYINDGVNNFINNYSSQKDCMYILEINKIISGCIAITNAGNETSQLRFFFVEPDFRGLGAGTKLIHMAIEFCREKKYKKIFLWTFSKLSAARHLYAKNGFQLTDTQKNNEWGEPVFEEKWDLIL
jgi:GNAT superfamily N-acetyltransferase